MIDKKAIAILALVLSLPIISTIAATGTNPALAFNFNKNEKIAQRNLCINRALCQNRYSQAPRNSFGLEQQPLSSSWSLSSTSPGLTPSLGKITTPGITMSDISSIGPSPPGSVIGTIPVGSTPFGIAFDSANGDLYVTNYGNNTVSIINGQTNTVVGNPIPVGRNPQGIAYDSANGDLYVVNFFDASVSVIDGQTNTVIKTVGVGGPGGSGQGPVFIVFDSVNGDLYVSNPRSNDVSVISGSTNTLVDTKTGNDIPILNAPEGMAFDPNNGNVYVATEGGAIAVISGQSNTVITTIPAFSFEGPYKIAFDQANGNLYVTNADSNTVTVISGQNNTVIGTPITVGFAPQDITYDSANGNLYVVVLSGAKVSVISGQNNTVIGTPITVGFEPQSIAFDSANDNLYVTNRGDNTVSVIRPAHSTTLTISPISNVPSGGTVTVTGKLTDNEMSNAGIGGKTITFTGTGAGNISSVITNPDGTFTVTGAAPNTVATGWTVQAHFAGGSSYVASNSAIQTYNTFSTTLPDTTITSGTDGNGAAVKDGGTTLSTSIHITFTGQAGTNPIAGFQCSLDSSKFSSCTSPFVANNLAAGEKYSFQVLAIDTLGNKDPTPAQFSWTVLTPTQGIEQLIQLIKSMNLDHGLQTSLIASLNAALDSLNHNNHVSACNQLSAFVSKVNAEVVSGRLSTANALQLIQSAQAIQNALGCK